MRASGIILFSLACACSPVQSTAFLFEFICSLPLINLLCGNTQAPPLDEFEGLPRWVETTSRSFWDWLFPPFTPSHVVCFVYDSEVTKKAFLMGGILGPKQVSVYDPTDRTWTRVKSAPIEFHHTQCIPVGSKIYIVSAFTGSGFTDEKPIKDTYVYDMLTDNWETRTGLPEGRHRAGAASVYYKGKIYVSHGGGHGDSPSTRKLDAYDIEKDEWVTGLPDAPNAREHVGGSLVNGTIFCVGGGRVEQGDVETAIDFLIPTDCYDLDTGIWSEKEPLPRGRRAASYGTTCDGKLVISGGVALGQTFAAVDVFDGQKWTPLPDLTAPRFGHGLAVNCDCNEMYVAGGVPSLNGIPFNNLLTAETYFPSGDDEQPCLADSNPSP